MATKHKKRRVVLASGVFDLLHLGHVKFLEEAKKAGGENAELIVIILNRSRITCRFILCQEYTRLGACFIQHAACFVG